MLYRGQPCLVFRSIKKISKLTAIGIERWGAASPPLNPVFKLVKIPSISIYHHKWLKIWYSLFWGNSEYSFPRNNFKNLSFIKDLKHIYTHIPKYLFIFLLYLFHSYMWMQIANTFFYKSTATLKLTVCKMN